MVKKLKCGIVDDEQHAIDLLKYHVEKVEFLALVFETTKPINAFEILQRESIDLLFLDIQMAELNGLDLLKLIQGKCKVILTTAYSEYALESYEYGVIDYLLKPITFNRFLKAVQKIQLPVLDKRAPTLVDDGVKKAFFVKSGARNTLVKIDLEALIYIESQGNYVYFHFEKEKIRTQLTLKKVEAELANAPFLRIHQSYIVAPKHIKMLEGNCIVINGKSLPIGEKYKEDVKRNILDKTLL